MPQRSGAAPVAIFSSANLAEFNAFSSKLVITALRSLLYFLILFKKYSVNEGDAVIIISKFKNTEVSTGGIAMKSGNIGDILEVKNSRSGKIVKGTLKKNKKINVFF